MIPIDTFKIIPFLNTDIFCIKTLGIFKYNYGRIKAERIELYQRGKLLLMDEESKVMQSLNQVERISTKLGRILDYNECIRSQSYFLYGVKGEHRLSYEGLDDIIGIYKYYILGTGKLNEYIGVNEQHYLEWLRD